MSQYGTVPTLPQRSLSDSTVLRYLEQKSSSEESPFESKESSLKQSSFFLLAAQFFLLIFFAYSSPYVVVVDQTMQLMQSTFVPIQLLLLGGFGLCNDNNNNKWVLVFLIVSLGIPLGIVLDSVLANSDYPLAITSLVEPQYAVACVLVTFGAVEVQHPACVLGLLAMEMPVFAFNNMLLRKLEVWDAGGALAVHVFGAYFALSMSFPLRHELLPTRREKKESSPPLLAFIGILILWTCLPSFISARMLGENARIFLHTVMAMCFSTVTGLALCAAWERPFCVSDWQRCSLAGGVAIGPLSHVVSMAGAGGIGMLASACSLAGLYMVGPWLTRQFGIHDSCGQSHAVHGIPGVVSAVASAVFAIVYGNVENQAWIQLTGLCVTLSLALLSGALTGKVLQLLLVSGNRV